MTISTTESKILYTGNGSTTTFSVPFNFDSDTDLKVELITIADNTVTAQTLNADYTVSGTDVVMTTAPASTKKILITLDLDFEQSTNYIPNDPFPAETHEDALDELAKQIKQLKYVIDYNIPKLPGNILTSSLVTDTNISANYAFTINSSADGIELQEVTSLLDITGLSSGSVALQDYFLFADNSDSNTHKYGSIQSLYNLFSLGSSSYGISNLDDVTITSIAAGEILKWNGSAWINNTLAEAGIAAASHAHAASDVTSGTFADARIAESNVTQHEAALTITESQISDLAHITQEQVEDWVGAMVSGNTETNITVTYQDADGTIDFEVSDSFLLNTGDIGIGSYDFGDADDFEIPNSATPTVDTAGQIAIDTTITDHTGLMTYHDGTEALYVIAVPTANLGTTDGHVIAYNATNNEFEMVAQSGGGGGLTAASSIALGKILR